MKQLNNVVLRPDQHGLRFYADYVQAEKVFDNLIRRLSEKGVPYDTAQVPQADHFLPRNLEKGGKQHANFLFMLCFWMRGGVESDTAAIFLAKMHEENPVLFEPQIYNQSTSKTVDLIAMVRDELIKHRLNQRVKENAVGWVYNMRKIARHWNGDPRNLMNDKPSFDTLVSRIIGKTTSGDNLLINEDSPNGFMFFRHKMTAMIAYFLMDFGLVPHFYTPVPVDFHVLRLLVTNLILRVEGLDVDLAIGIDFTKAEALKAARDVTEWYCRERKVSPIALCDSLWLLSRTLCRNNPGNSGYVLDIKRKQQARKARTRDAQVEEEILVGMESDFPPSDSPIEISGRKRYQGLRFTFEDLMEKSRARRIEQTCGRCPVRETCTYNISSGHYYVGGKLVPERRRVVPSESQINFLNLEGFSSLKSKPSKAKIRFAEIHLD